MIPATWGLLLSSESSSSSPNTPCSQAASSLMSLIICTAISRYFAMAPAFLRKNPPFSSAIDDTIFAASERVPVKNDSFPAIRYAATARSPIARHISTIGPTSCRAKSQITLRVIRSAFSPPRTIHQVLQQRLQRVLVLRVQHQLDRVDHRGEGAHERGNHVLDLHFGHDLHRRLEVSGSPMNYAGRSDLEGEIRTLQRATQNGDDLGNVLGDKLSSRHGIEGTDSLLSLSSPRRYRPSTRTSDSWEQAERTKGNNAGHSGSRLLTWEITSHRLWRTRASLSTWNNWGRKDKTREKS